ncbi:hydroxypyruvate isomerase [Paraburkholderia caballeronis]|uniref:hydroxypyruvate isomerase family protein n=1 Tax=Paraburkholderia caballeronis TaxID=416943 RepID=UPI001065A8CF|nr:TIM barrel protein [Paraburkholderia caballeronis]TDV33861.1 hydroxypyruvate isomerase [Paraburkholderia caballeronis]
MNGSTQSPEHKPDFGACDSRIRFAANLKWLFTDMPFLERFEAAATEGFSAVEYASPYEYDPAVLTRELKRWKLKQVLINTPAGEPGTAGSNGYGCLPGYVDVFRDGVDRAIACADALGCGLIHLLAGRVPDGCAPSDADAAFRANLSWAAKRAAGRDVTFVLECLNQHDVPGYFLRSLSHARTFIREVGASNVKLLFDVYHAGMSGVDARAEFAEHRHDIAHIQVADVPGRHEPGSGGMPWSEIARAVADSGYAGWIGCEYRPLATTAAGLGWRKDFWRAAEARRHTAD